MLWLKWLFASLPLLFVIPSAAAAADPTAPDWIWSHDTTSATTTNQNCRLERTFEIAGAIQSANLRLAADFCQATVELNGRPVLTALPYSPTSGVDVTLAVKPGENRIAVLANPVPGPAAIAGSLVITAADGRKLVVNTDHRWTAPDSGRSAVSMGNVDPALWGVGRRPPTIDPFDNYEQWRQALGASANESRSAFWAAPGFEISLVRSAQADEGSWVSMAFDPQGRLTIAREDKGLLRMTLASDRRSISRVETINDDLLECRGLLYAYDSLYVNANNSKGLFRLRDTDTDGKFEDVRLLRHFPGSVGHGRNDLALGPDGLIYSIHGDAVDLPTSEITDRTSPFRESRRGRATKEGHLIRTDRDGKQWELVAAGLRNPFGIAFHPDGELFTYDADAEFDMGTPWYRPTRIVQLVTGADYGWRGVTGKWPPYFPDHPDNALPTLDIGKGSPTSVAFGTLTKFPADYRSALFVLDWAYGRILAVHLAPRGAGFRAQAETFLKGRPLNVTDLAVGPDGALYIVTGGRKTQSALYRIAYIGAIAEPQPLSPHESACRDHAAAMRPLRRGLEEHHRPAGAAAVDAAWPYLDSSDPVIRHAARIAIEHQALELWRDKALAERRPTASLTALLGLVRSGDKTVAASVIDRLLAHPIKDLSLDQTLTLVHAYSLCSKQSPELVAARKPDIIAQLNPVFLHPASRWPHVSPEGTSANLQRDLAMLLVESGSPTAVEKVTQSLLASAAQEDRLHALLVLRNVFAGWTDKSRRAYFTALNEASTFVGGEGMPRFLAKLKEESLATLSDREKQELTDVLEPAAQPNTAGPASSPRPVVKRWTLDDLEPLLTASKKGDASRGAIIFRDALCIRCHRVGARGPAVGPDLTHAAGRFSRRDMLESILAPSQVVAENYRNAHIRTTDGRTIVGRVLVEGDYRSEKLRIATEPLLPSAVVELSKRDIEQVSESETSPMPQGLLDPFNLDEILDLLSFLESGATLDTAGR
jgi:putative heme-binding domain-containing protein